MSHFNLSMSDYVIEIVLEKKMQKLFVNSSDPDQTPHCAASDLCLHFLLITFFLGVKAPRL